MIPETLEIIRLDSPPWMVDGLCGNGDYDPDDWFPYMLRPDDQKRTERAMAVCGECPVRSECLKWAYETDDAWGVCGGTTPRQRKRVRTRMQRKMMEDLGVDNGLPVYRGLHVLGFLQEDGAG